jgi:hypothetical protein
MVGDNLHYGTRVAHLEIQVGLLRDGSCTGHGLQGYNHDE